jgi:glycosyltransferase involved in cell wall biosynthesis
MAREADLGPDSPTSRPDLRVLIADPSDRGGLAPYTEQLVGVLRQEGVVVYRAGPKGIGDAGFELAGRRWGPEVETLGRARLYSLRLKELIPAAKTLRRAVRRCAPDIVHLQAEVVPGFEHLALVEMRRRAGVVLTVHDPESMSGRAEVLSGEIRRWRCADSIIVHSIQARSLVATKVPGVPVHAVPVDLNLSNAVVSQAEAREHLGLGPGPIAMVLGFLRPYKGLGLLSSAWPSVARALPEARLMLVGEAYTSEELDRLSALEGVEIRPGFLRDEEIDLWAAAADVLVMPYDRGSHSGVLHRALAVGTPVLASPQLAEEVQSTGAGRVVELDVSAWSDAMSRALGRDPLPPPRPPGGGRATARATIDVYAEVLERRAAVADRVASGD